MTGARTDVLIAGGGLSGLAVAEALEGSGVDYRLVEARARIGGRILSDRAGGGRFDLGPAWIWPHNHRILALAGRLGVDLHRQYATGNLVYQDQAGAVRRDLEFSTMGGALRAAGGLARLTEGLAAVLSPDRLLLGTTLKSVRFGPEGLTAVIVGPEGAGELHAQRLVLALPPRLVAERIGFSRALPQDVSRAFQATPTWMAGHAKVLAVYGRPFWREAGLSGDAISHRGPLMELHDATDEGSGTPAIFAFAMPGAAGRPGFEDAARAQLVELFGPDAAVPEALLAKDWSADPETATAADAVPPAGHPAYGFTQGMRRALDDWSGGRIVFAGTESATEEGGFLEGALAAAEDAVSGLRRSLQTAEPVSHPAP